MGKTLYLMQGVPGSGKTTVAKHLADKVEGIIFSTDDFWYKNAPKLLPMPTPKMIVSGDASIVDRFVPLYNFDPDRLGEAHQWNQQRTAKEMASSDGGHIIIDNTNIKARDAHPYVVLAEIFGYDVEVIRVEVPLKVALDRNSKRSEDRSIPADVISRMYAQMERLV